MKTSILLAAAAVAMSTAMPANAAKFMDATWAKGMCDAWNANDKLTTGLGGDKWMKNDAGRGYKIIQLYRTQCGPQTKVELKIVPKDGKAMCAAGGPVTQQTMNKDVDYVMHATDDDWTCMGQGKFGCGAMGAMMTGKLKFEGPKGEAMGVMGPFDGFLVATGSVPGDKAGCP
jgi:putative sterol carrier protein